jgi:hypothetical protein
VSGGEAVARMGVVVVVLVLVLVVACFMAGRDELKCSPSPKQLPTFGASHVLDLLWRASVTLFCVGSEVAVAGLSIDQLIMIHGYQVPRTGLAAALGVACLEAARGR